MKPGRSLRRARLGADGADVSAVNKVLLVHIVLATDLDEPGLSIYCQAGTVAVVVAAEDIVYRAFGRNGCVPSAASRLKVVVFNYAAIDRVCLNRILAGAKDVVVANLTTLEPVEKNPVAHKAIDSVFPAANRDVVCRYD